MTTMKTYRLHRLLMLLASAGCLVSLCAATPAQAVTKGEAAAVSKVNSSGSMLENELVELATSSPARADLGKKAMAVERLIKTLPEEESAAAALGAANKLRGTDYGAQLHFILGHIYERLKRPKEAIEQYRLGLAIKPNVAAAYARIGRIETEYYQDYEAALMNMKKACTLNPRDIHSRLRYYSLSRWMATRDTDLAWRLKESLNKALGRGQQSPR